MKVTKFATLLLLSALLFACGKSKSPAGIEKFQTELNAKQLTPSEGYLNSIKSLDSEIENQLFRF
jgi:hypothetical protein